jgi:hypothetical protein
MTADVIALISLCFSSAVTGKMMTAGTTEAYTLYTAGTTAVIKVGKVTADDT